MASCVLFGVTGRVELACLPALASIMLLAVTNQLCQNVAVFPLLWIAPLCTYLISFIICFDKERWYRRRWFANVELDIRGKHERTQ